MDVGTGGHKGHVPPPPSFHRCGQSAPFHETLLPFLIALRNQTKLANCTFPAISKNLSFKISWGSITPDSLAN